MVTAADWIKVELNAADLALADEVGSLHYEHRQQRGFAVYGVTSLRTCQLGAAGEVAVARYCRVAYTVQEYGSYWSYERDRHRGYDVGGYQVRCRERPGYGLSMNQGRRLPVGGRPWLLALAHALPRIWLVGWITAEGGTRAGQWRHDNGVPWFLVEQRDLLPLPEQNGYTRRGEEWLVDPQTPFWCEECDGTHSIIEHRQCRTLRHVENSARQQLLTARASRVTGQLYPPQGKS